MKAEYWVIERIGLDGRESIPTATFSLYQYDEVCDYCDEWYDHWEFVEDATKGEQYDAVVSEVTRHEP